MLEENRRQRNGIYRQELGDLAYERYRLLQQVEACQRRMAEIDKIISKWEGALSESEQGRRDIETEDKINEAKAQAKIENKDENGGKNNA